MYRSLAGTQVDDFTSPARVVVGRDTVEVSQQSGDARVLHVIRQLRDDVQLLDTQRDRCRRAYNTAIRLISVRFVRVFLLTLLTVSIFTCLFKHQIYFTLFLSI